MPLVANGQAEAEPLLVVPLPDAVRQAIFNSAGDQSIYGVSIHELNELGLAKKYNTLFKNYYSGTFTDAVDEIVVGVDLSKGAFKRVVETDPLSNSTFTVSPDDQFPIRSDKLGFFGACTEGRTCIDARAINGLRVRTS